MKMSLDERNRIQHGEVIEADFHPIVFNLLFSKVANFLLRYFDRIHRAQGLSKELINKVKEKIDRSVI